MDRCVICMHLHEKQLEAQLHYKPQTLVCKQLSLPHCHLFLCSLVPLSCTNMPVTVHMHAGDMKMSTVLKSKRALSSVVTLRDTPQDCTPSWGLPLTVTPADRAVLLFSTVLILHSLL